MLEWAYPPLNLFQTHKMFFGYIKRTWLKQVQEYASHSTQAKTKGIIIISPQIGTLLKANNKWRAPGVLKYISVHMCEQKCVKRGPFLQ